MNQYMNLEVHQHSEEFVLRVHSALPECRLVKHTTWECVWEGCVPHSEFYWTVTSRVGHVTVEVAHPELAPMERLHTHMVQQFPIPRPNSDSDSDTVYVFPEELYISTLSPPVLGPPTIMVIGVTQHPAHLIHILDRLEQCVLPRAGPLV